MTKKEYLSDSWRLIFHKPFYSKFFVIFITYIIIVILLSWFVSSLQLFAIYNLKIKTMHFIFAVILSLIVSFFVALNSIKAYVNYISNEKYILGSILTGIAAILGITAGFCPLSIAGLFPTIFSLFGFTIEFQEFPILGIEIQMGVLILLFIGSYILNKE